MSETQRANYLSFLLRLRRDSETTPWRVTVVNPHTGEEWGLGSLRKFVAFLERQTGEKLTQFESAKDEDNG